MYDPKKCTDCFAKFEYIPLVYTMSFLKKKIGKHALTIYFLIFSEV